MTLMLPVLDDDHELIATSWSVVQPNGERIVTSCRIALLDGEGEPIDESCNCDIDYACNYPPCVMRNDLIRRWWEGRPGGIRP